MRTLLTFIPPYHPEHSLRIKLPYEQRYRHAFRRSVQRPSTGMDLRRRLPQMPEATGFTSPNSWLQLFEMAVHSVHVWGHTHTHRSHDLARVENKTNRKIKSRTCKVQVQNRIALQSEQGSFDSVNYLEICYLSYSFAKSLH